MSVLNWRSTFAILPLAFLVGCITTVDEGNGDGTVRVNLQASYEKQVVTGAGYGGLVTAPARYAYAEIRQVSNNALLAGGYLGLDGTGYADIPGGSSVYARIFAAYEVPANSGSSFFFRGSVVNASYYTSVPFEQTSDWYVDSATFNANSSGTLSVKALASNRIAGAFNIADQAVSLGLKVRDLEPSLRLPNLHTYWTTSSNPNDQARTYPVVLKTAGGQVVKTGSGRAVFTHAVYGNASGAAWSEQDEWDDGTVVKTMAHLLFADRSAQPDGTSEWSFLRRDNYDWPISWGIPAEPSVAFVNGFADFLAGAAIGRPNLLDSYINGSGQLMVDDFNLSVQSQISPGNRGEFTRGSIAISLWGIWQNALGGNSAALQTLWQSVRSTTVIPDGSGEFDGSALACYPTYLSGLRARTSPGAWTNCVAQLNLQSIPEPTPAYFLGERLWRQQPGSGSVVLRESASGYEYFFDRDQVVVFRMPQSATTTRTITLSAPGGGLWLEVYGPRGYVGGSFNGDQSTQTLQLTNLAAGVYAVRVEVRYREANQTPQSGTRSFSISY